MAFALSILVAALSLQEPAEKVAGDLAAAIEKGINAGDASALDAVFDADALIDRVLTGVPANDAFKAGYRKSAKKGLAMGGKIVEALKGEPGYKCLRVRAVDGKQRAQFRMVLEDSFNYHDYLIDRTPAGGARIVDMHVAVTGEWLSETLRRMCLAAIAQEPGSIGKLVGKENEYVKNLAKIQTMNKLHGEGKHAEALKIYAGLPPSVQKEKSVLTIRIMIAAEVSQPEWFRALDDLKKAYPGDPCVSLHSIGPLVAMKQFDKAIQAIEDLDKVVGGDPYLQIQRAEAYYAAGDIDQALVHAKKSTAMDKDLADGFWMQVTLSLKKKTFAETAKLLTHLEETFGVEIGDVGKIELYKEFSESPECKAWLESRKKK